MLTKKMSFDNDVLAILRAMNVSLMDGQYMGVITSGQLERDLYLRVNKALEAMGGKWNREAKGHVFDDDPRQYFNEVLTNGKIEVARDGWFPTPLAVIRRMVELVPPEGEILEPSAGEGAIVDYLCGMGIEQTSIRCVEINDKRVKVLRDKGYAVFQGDFTRMVLPIIYDRVYMNPPFENLQDIDHVRQAYDFLLPSGGMVSVMSTSFTFNPNRKAVDFREWLREVGGLIVSLPDKSFHEIGTDIRSCLVVIWKKAQELPTVKVEQLNLF